MPLKQKQWHADTHICARMLMYVCDHTNIKKMYSTNIEERALMSTSSVVTTGQSDTYTVACVHTNITKIR